MMLENPERSHTAKSYKHPEKEVQMLEEYLAGDVIYFRWLKRPLEEVKLRAKVLRLENK